ncbi:hypothetical protein Amsp01_026570 [Amycolatopsis sp. NBRC 101858]|nr:hypothetical protein Amsp01_026570 [Amycolatopsis sp. NBRC 101858]
MPRSEGHSACRRSPARLPARFAGLALGLLDLLSAKLPDQARLPAEAPLNPPGGHPRLTWGLIAPA